MPLKNPFQGIACFAPTKRSRSPSVSRNDSDDASERCLTLQDFTWNVENISNVNGEEVKRLSSIRRTVNSLADDVQKESSELLDLVRESYHSEAESVCSGQPKQGVQEARDDTPQHPGSDDVRSAIRESLCSTNQSLAALQGSVCVPKPPECPAASPTLGFLRQLGCISQTLSRDVLDPIILQNLLEIRYGIENLQRQMHEEALRARQAAKKARESKPVIQETFDVIKESIRALSVPSQSQMQATAAAQMRMMREIRDSIFSIENREQRSLYAEPEPVSIYDGQGLVGTGSLVSRRSVPYSRGSRAYSIAGPRGTLPPLPAPETAYLTSLNLGSQAPSFAPSIVAPHSASMVSAQGAPSWQGPAAQSGYGNSINLGSQALNPTPSIVGPHSASMVSAPGAPSWQSPAAQSVYGNSINLGSQALNPTPSIVGPHSASMVSAPGAPSWQSPAAQSVYGNSINLGSQALNPTPSIVGPHSASMVSAPGEPSWQSPAAQSGYGNSTNLGSQALNPTPSIVVPQSVSRASVTALSQASQPPPQE
ncbi:hypothetical protein AAHC03_024217 [Spirometra sp. Aus1]